MAGRDSGVGGEYLMDCQPAPGRFWRHRYMGDKDKEERFYKEVRYVMAQMIISTHARVLTNILFSRSQLGLA